MKPRLVIEAYCVLSFCQKCQFCFGSTFGFPCESCRVLFYFIPEEQRTRITQILVGLGELHVLNIVILCFGWYDWRTYHFSLFSFSVLIKKDVVLHWLRQSQVIPFNLGLALRSSSLLFIKCALVPFPPQSLAHSYLKYLLTQGKWHWALREMNLALIS